MSLTSNSIARAQSAQALATIVDIANERLEAIIEGIKLIDAPLVLHEWESEHGGLYSVHADIWEELCG